MAAAEAPVSTAIVLVTGSALTLAFGSTRSTALVTLRAQPPQVMFPTWNRIRISFLRTDEPLIRLPASGRSSTISIGIASMLKGLKGPSPGKRNPAERNADERAASHDCRCVTSRLRHRWHDLGSLASDAGAIAEVPRRRSPRARRPGKRNRPGRSRPATSPSRGRRSSARDAGASAPSGIFVVGNALRRGTHRRWSDGDHAGLSDSWRRPPSTRRA